MSLRAFLRVSLALVIVGCASGSSTGPHSPGITFISGNRQTDTAQTTLSVPLVALIIPPSGQSANGLTVQFSAVSVSGTPEAYVGVPGDAAPGAGLNAVTDNTGKASVIITLGHVAGPALVIAKVAQFGYVDTARFTVTPGQPFSLSTSPRDTALYAGASITPRVVATDQFRNARSDAVTLRVLSGPATVNGAVVSANAIGRVMFTAAADGFLDTAYVSVVPPGRLAAAYGPGIVVFNTDGSNVDTIPVPVGTLVGTVKWAPSGQGFVIDLEQYGPCQGSSGSIRTVDLHGHITVVDSSPYYGDIYPQYSRDGTWIYFSKYPWYGTNGTSGGIWRVHPDGTGEDSVAIPNSTWDQGGSSSPDNEMLAYAGIGPDAQSLRILNIGTGTVTNLNVWAYLPQWSPTSTQIANSGCGSSISVVNADGSGNHIVSPPSDPYNPAIDWSPDGQWIVAEQGLDHVDRIINVASGLVLPLGWTSDFVSPTWSPSGNMSGLPVPSIRRRHTDLHHLMVEGRESETPPIAAFANEPSNLRFQKRARRDSNSQPFDP